MKDNENKQNVKTIVLESKDDYGTCLEDSCFSNNDKERKPKGHVHIYEVDESFDLKDGDSISDALKDSYYHGKFNIDKPVDDDNLIVYSGREWLGSAIFGVTNTNISASYDERVYWLGVGRGGAPEGDPFSPTNPTNDDTGLSESVMINSDDDNTCADYRDDPDSGYYKKKISEVEFEQDESNDDAYLVVKATTTITGSDANDETINEAGLFSATSSEGGHDGNFTLFSRVTFPSISKDSSRQLVFVWYIYT